MKHRSNVENQCDRVSYKKSPASKQTHSHEDAVRGIITIPNLLCVGRLVGSPVLIVLAWTDLPAWSLALFLVLWLTDWLDGKLAWLLRQKTSFGAWLDSIADAIFYAAVLVSTLILYGHLMLQEWIWIGMAVVTYITNLTASLIRFRRLPSYHTRMAKTAWLFLGVAIVALYAEWSVWPLRVAMAAVALTNIEETLITFALSNRRSNIPSLYHAIKAERTC